jgi:predicted GIY-YIG superfamily endonuclease
MYYVYIIQSIKYPKRFYTGFTENIDSRLDNHNSGKLFYTNKYRPWKLIYYCAFECKKKALDFERYLKTASGIASEIKDRYKILPQSSFLFHLHVIGSRFCNTYVFVRKVDF